MDESKLRKNRRNLTVETGHEDEQRQLGAVPQKTPAGVRGSRDLRSPGAQKTPVAQAAKHHDGAVGRFVAKYSKL